MRHIIGGDGSTMDENAETDELGYLGEYGVLIVPPTGAPGQWLVGLAAYDADAEEYAAGTDGPLLTSREEAIEMAGRVLDWLARQTGDEDLIRVWQQMQEQLGAADMEQQWPPERGPWGPIIR